MTTFMEKVQSRSLVERAFLGTAAAIGSAPFGAAFGALGGFVYAKLAHLPAGQAAKAYAVWAAATFPLRVLVGFLIKEPKYRHLASAGISLISYPIGIYEVRRRGLMGDKLLGFTVLLAAFAIVVNVAQAAHAVLSKNKTEE